jgi:hypothetical protein
MGNQTSQQSSQKGAGYTDNFNDLQNKIESLVVNSKKNNFTETINFSNSSDLDLDSIRDQEGGKADSINVRPRRSRYLRFVQSGQPSTNNLVGGGDNTMELSSIDEKDFQILKDILQQHQTGGNLLHTDKNDMELSATSPQPVNFASKFSPTSHSDMNLVGGSFASKFSPTSYSDMELAGGCKLPTNAQTGGCGCNDITSSPNDIIRKPTHFKALVGGNKEKSKELTSESEEENSDDNEDDEDDEDDSEEDSEEDEDEDDHDENSDGDELARSRDSSSSDKKKKQRKQKRHHSEYIETSDDELSGGSTEEHVLTKKYIYSEHDTFYGSDDNSEYYKHIKNRSMVN